MDNNKAILITEVQSQDDLGNDYLNSVMRQINYARGKLSRKADLENNRKNALKVTPPREKRLKNKIESDLDLLKGVIRNYALNS